jgi:hypothetical protein
VADVVIGSAQYPRRRTPLDNSPELS